MHTDNKIELPKERDSLWLSTTNLPSFPRLDKNISTEILVIGGGIAGITNAYVLCKEGYKVTLIEGDKLLRGTTGHTTAKVTVQHNIIYDEFINHLGLEKAKLYYEGNNEALNFIRELILSKHIDCGYQEETAYVYTNSKEYEEKLIKEFKAYGSLGIENCEYLDKLTIPIDIISAIAIKNQFQFHPLQYLLYLLSELVAMGCTIYEDTQALELIPDELPKIITTGENEITAMQVVIATHFPCFDKKGLYFARMYADRSYVLAIKPKKEFLGGMYKNAEDPSRSIRSVMCNGEQLLLIGGESHKTGQSPDTLLHYEALREFAEESYGIDSIKYRWSTQDLTTLDKVPYIGNLTVNTENIYVATGFNKWGMTNGTLSALIIKDLILNKSSAYKDLFTPTRFYADPSLKKVVSINADVAKHLVKGKVEEHHESFEDLNIGEGKVVGYKGKRAGAYKDESGKVYVVDTTCTHLGCEVNWNNGEKSWDCPCHGSRFNYKGEVIEGPAKEALEILRKE